MKPWTRGYAEYKTKKIKQALANNPFKQAELPSGYGFRIDERVVEYPWFFARLPEHATGRLLDAGSVLNFDIVLRQPAMQAKKVFISTLAPEALCYWQDGISYVYEDLRDSCFKSEYFDWIASLSTIEHIGLDNTMLYTSDTTKKEDYSSSYLAAIREYHRMLKPGGVLYLSFPFGKRQKRDWFQIFDGEMVDELIAAFGPSRQEVFYYKYESAGWQSSSRELSKDATYFDIHTQRIHDADYAAASRAIVCLELVK
ncbi:MAG: methyltransferase domain-containing protein [Gallionella sp.]|nr:methyltransferase domain-containing protein [Gallionella sp.]MDD5611462.1 methyltransferase domain-containing protein [Gallionella sp.]